MTNYVRRNRGNRKASAIVSKYSRWVRLYTSARNDPKILSLSERRRWQWMCLLMLAGETADGVLPPAQHIAIELRCTSYEAEDVIDEMILSGLLDIVHRDGGIVTVRPHNWDRRQFVSDQSSSTDRVRRHRERRALCNVSETGCNGFRSDSVSVTFLEDRKTVSQEEEQDSLDSDYTHEEDVA